MTDYRIFRPMNQLKLIVGLQMLEKEDWFSFRKYLLMYCSKTSDNYTLVEVLFRTRDDLGSIKNAEEIRKQFFAGMSPKSFSNLMSRIFIWFEEWLVWSERKKDSISNDVELVKIYNRRGIYTLANKTFTKVEKKLKADASLSLLTHKNLFLINHYRYFSDNPIKYKKKEEILDGLISYFLLQFKEQSLIYTSELHNWGRIQNFDYSKEIELLTAIESLVQDSEVTRILQWVIRLVRELDVEAFFNLRDSITGNQINVNSELFILATFYMVNYSMQLWNAGKIQDSQIVFDAYDFGLESGVLLNTGKIPFLRFIKAVTTLGYIKDAERSYEFVDKWVHLVASENQSSAHALGYAHLKLIEGKSNELIPLLIGKKFETEWGRMRASSLELIGHYTDRKNDYSLLVNRIKNFKRVLKTFGNKNKNLAYKVYFNFITVLDLLSKRDFIKVRIDIDRYTPILHKKWLEDEIKAGQK